jgi:membrane protease YdiL (CAAX protease family)
MEDSLLLRFQKIKSLWTINQWIKSLSPFTELIIVITIGFGLFIYSSTYGFFLISSNFNRSWTYRFTSQGEYSIVIYEIIALSIITWILKVRNWSLKDFNLDFAVRLIWIGLLLLFVRNMMGGMIFRLLEVLNVVDDKAVNHVKFAGKADFTSMVLMIVINSVYEEVLLVGYLFKRLEKYSPVLIIGFSLLVRALFHTYQGYMMLFSIVPLGLVFGYYYYKYQKLLPLIIAHGMNNAFAFIALLSQNR